MPTKYEAYCPICYKKKVFDTPFEAGEWIEEHTKSFHRDLYLTYGEAMPSAKILIAKATTKIDDRVDGVSETYTAGEEKSKLLISAEGAVTISFEGDGDAAIEMRVYVDGTMEQSFTADQSAIVTAGFTTSLEIKSYAAAAVTAKFSSFHASGWRFV